MTAPRHPMKLSVWSGPRNVSTALMYSFRQRSDTVVVDEPLYGHYLTVTGADHPGAARVMEAMEADGERVVRDVILAPSEKPVRFFKNMAHHIVGLDRSFLAEITNVLLTRDPEEMLPSLAKQLPNLTLRDTGLVEQTEILETVLEQNEEPIVLDARDLLLDPGTALQKVCAKLGVPFEESMLSWPSGPKPEDGVWAEHWYDNVHASTGFSPYRRKAGIFPERLKPLLNESRHLYERLRRYAITADG